MGKKIKSLKGSQCCEGMHFGGKTGCIEKMFVKLEMTRASPGSSLVNYISSYVQPTITQCLKWMDISVVKVVKKIN